MHGWAGTQYETRMASGNGRLRSPGGRVHSVDMEVIRSNMQRSCHVCGSVGEVVYSGLEDRLFKAPGAWDLKRCLNRDCGLIWLDPAPCPADIHKAYANYYTHRDGAASRSLLQVVKEKAKRGYRARKFAFEADKATALDYLLGFVIGLLWPGREYLDYGFAQLADLEKGRLLEIGCGKGHLLALMSRWGWACEGLDFDDTAVGNARQKGLKVVLGDLESQRYPEGKFDAILSSHVIEHVMDPKALVTECLRVLRPGGRCIVVTPNVLAWSHRLFGRHWRGLEPPRHLHLFAPQSLRNLVASCGAEDIRMTASARIASRIFCDSLGSCLDSGTRHRPWYTLLGEATHVIEWGLMKTALASTNEMICVFHRPLPGTSASTAASNQ